MDAGDPPGRVDFDASHASRRQQDRVGEWAERHGAMAGCLRGDAQLVVARVVHDRADVIGVQRHRDQRGMLVDGEVPRLASRIPFRLAWCHDPASDRGDEVADGDGHGVGIVLGTGQAKSVHAGAPRRPLGWTMSMKHGSATRIPGNG